jgi:RimJ/RimL family protein N-acetyltransferase
LKVKAPNAIAPGAGSHQGMGEAEGREPPRAGSHQGKERRDTVLVRELETERLILRRWRAEDREPFARMNGDAEVMEFFPATLTPPESDALAGRIEAHFEERGFAPWAAELRAEARFIGYIGLAVPRFKAHFTPCVEIGWRLERAYWGRGLAVEGACAAVHHAFEVLGLAKLVSFATEGNLRSRRVMEKLGMTHDASEDFDHPELPEGHPLRRHVLYRLSRDAWRAGARS